MINEYNNLILVKGEDKTSDILSWTFDKNPYVIWITYRSGKRYPYNTMDVCFYKNPKHFALTDHILLKKGVPCSGAKEVAVFEHYSRIYYQSGYKELVSNQNLKIIGSVFTDDKSRNIFEYYKPYSWEQRKLGDIGKTFTGLSGKTAEDFGHGEAKFLPYLNIFNNSLADASFLESMCMLYLD